MSNTFNQSMLMALQRMRRGGQYGKGGPTSAGTKPMWVNGQMPTTLPSIPSIPNNFNLKYLDPGFSMPSNPNWKNLDPGFSMPGNTNWKDLDPGFSNPQQNIDSIRQQLLNSPAFDKYRRQSSLKGGGSIGTKPYWIPNKGIPTNPRYNQAAINQEAMYEPAPGTIGPPMYPTTPQPYNDGQVGMGVIAPQTPTPTFAPPAPTGPTMAEVSSNYQQPKVNQKDFGKAWNEARNSGLKVFSFRNKMYTTDARTDAGKGAARKAATSMVQSNREYATIADQRMVGFSKNNPYTVTSSSPVTQSQSQTNGNSVPWGKIAGAGVTTAVGMGILGLGTGAIKYPESYMTPKEFIKDAKRNIASKYMTPRELAQSMKKPKYPSNYMTPGEFTKTMTDKLKSMKLPNVSYPKGYMTPKEFAKDVSSKLPKLKKPSISYPQGYMTPKDVKNEMANLKFPKVNVSNMPERIGTRAYQVPALRSSVKTADKAYKSMEKTAKRLFKRF